MMMNKYILFGLLIVLPLALSAQQKLSVLSYNVLKGLQADSVNQKTYLDWVENIAPDIVAYQEMNGFTQKTLEDFASQYGHPYAVLSKTDGFPVALSSKYPIVNVQKVVDNMWHAYIYANINNVHVFVVHFSPFSYRKRQAEVAEILARAALLPEGEPVMVMGDFNSLSVDESDAYDEKFLENQEAIEKRRKKVENLNNGQLDFSVTDAMKNAGFHDALHLHNKKFRHSAPTKKYFRDIIKRIDYVWVNDVLAKQVLKADIIYDDVTDSISDHYPLYIEIEN